MTSPPAPIINTYHCAFCTNLVLATTWNVGELPVRGNGVRGRGDGSLILWVGSGDGGDGEGEGEGKRSEMGDGEGEGVGEGNEGEGNGKVDVMDMDISGGQNGNGNGKAPLEETPSQPHSQSQSAKSYTSILSLIQSKRQIIVRREDVFGFEKRRLWRCGRCGVVVGYEVLGGEGGGEGGEREGMARGGRELGEGEGMGEGKGKILYLLRGGLMGTEVMAGGKKIGEGELELEMGVRMGMERDAEGLVGGGGVAVWG
ncbi:hypothetical protein SBOR_7495 [Sclerotinia borealis F-4128]|uniref:Yippee domain-containing protein n=1 Tax=Sclerotinia borealis (strain F-4128) TaxID=1432307 RepID=W9C8D1_SCLBF|nr:hypothetical protein SBOR_7495 [Sclerotinia borealis F-4128]